MLEVGEQSSCNIAERLLLTLELHIRIFFFSIYHAEMENYLRMS